MIGEDALVPPKTSQPPAPLSYTATPVFGSATAETSAMARRGGAPAGWERGARSRVVRERRLRLVDRPAAASPVPRGLGPATRVRRGAERGAADRRHVLRRGR